MQLDTQKMVENLSSRRLWMIIKTETGKEDKLINAAKQELMRRDQFKASYAFCAPH